MSRNDGEARHPATPVHLRAARERGDVARSFQLAGGIQLLVVLLLGSLFTWNLSNGIQTFTHEVWSSASINAGEFRSGDWVWSATRSVGMVILPLFGLLFLAGVASNIAQTGFMFMPGRVVPDVARLSPGHWWKRVFSLENVVSTMMEIPKLAVIVVIAIAACYASWEQIVGLSAYHVGEMTSRLFGLILKLGFQTALVLFFFGVLDFALQWVARQKRLRMTDDELREELRMQGNPESLQRQRQTHRQRVNEVSQ